MTLAKGTKVQYTVWGKPETATITRIANGLVWLDNGRWMHEESVSPVKSNRVGRSKLAKARKAIVPGHRCDQCEALMINGVFCHETGCPNAKSRYDAESDTWIKQRKCFECGCTVDADDQCCNAE